VTASFRQSITALHTWAGLLCAWVLYFVFLTGTLGYFDTEIDYWMRPEVPQPAAIDTARAIELAQRRVESQAPETDQFIIYPPSGRDIPQIAVFWRTTPDASGVATSRNEVLDRTTGLPIEARATGGGTALYEMHYALHYLPTSVAYWVVGVCTMFMLVAIVSGVIAHKRIFSDFFTFRPGNGQRSWLDAHNVLGVLALPFHLMITYSGFVFFCFTYMPFVVAAGYGAGPEARQTFFSEVFRSDATVRAGIAAPLASLTTMAARAEVQWGVGEVRSIDVRRAGDATARVTLTRAHVTPTSNGERLVFDGATGALLPSAADARSGARLVNDTMMSLHEGLFAGTAARWLYFLSGVFGTAMIATGLVVWTAKRRKPGVAAHAGLALVERLNVGTIAGLPVGIAVYFWANRLLPVDWPARAEWELHALFISWAAMLAHAAWRPPRGAWRDELALAGALVLLLPALNAVTTKRHLGSSIPAGDWAFAGFDLTALVFGAVLLLAAIHVSRRAGGARAVADEDASATPHAEAA
jgi:uncharacterized iron-regulated membrane protein